MAQVTFNFTGVTPVEGGAAQDYIAPGRYRLKITKFEDGASQNGNRMVTVSYETKADGKRLVDRFVLSSDFGMKRFMGLFVALGVKVPAGPVTLNTDKMIDRECDAQIGDDTLPASAEFPNPRTVSRITTYYFPAGYENGAAPAPAAPVAASVAEAAPAAPVAPPPPVEPAPAPAPAPAPVIAEAPVAAPVAAPVDVPVTSALDDLFG